MEAELLPTTGKQRNAEPHCLVRGRSKKRNSGWKVRGPFSPRRGTTLTYDSRIRHSPEGVDFPEKDPETPHVRLGGEFL